MEPIKQRLDQLRERIQDPDLLEGRGVSNEVNIRMFCYEPKDEMIVQEFERQIMSDPTLGCHLIVRNLYDIFLSLCEDLDILDSIPEMEENEGSDFLLEQIRSAIGPADFVPKLQYGEYQSGDILMLTGVGDVFPFMRVHSLLGAMQPFFPRVPILVMYPGSYDHHQTRLFNRLKPNNYYRAFSLI